MKIGMIGMGRLGLPVCTAIAYMGHEVFAYDIDPKKMQKDNFSAIETGPTGVGDFRHWLKTADIKFCTLQRLLDESEIVFVAVQTPHEEVYEGVTRIPKDRKDFNYTYLENALKTINDSIINLYNVPKHVVIISTVLPGTTKRITQNLNKIQVVYSPLFIAMGQVMKDYLNPEFTLMGGLSTAKVRDFYKTIHCAPIIEMSIESAELTKVAYNTFIGMKIAFANTIMEICHSTEADVDEVTGALKKATDRLISGKYLDAGMGDGGGCFLGDQIIYTKDGPKNIEDIELGDFVLSKNGKLERVTENYKRPYKGKILKIKGRGLPYVCVTPEHPFHVAKDGRNKYITNGIEKCDNTKNLVSQLGEITQIQAGELTKDYYLTFPIPQKSDLPFEGSSSYWDEYLEIAGYYLSEGSIWIRKDRNNKPYRVEFCMHEEEQEDLNKIESCLRKIYPEIHCTRIKKPDSKAETLRVNSLELAEKLLNDFGHLAEGKKIPANLLYGHLHHASLLLKGLWRGDGSSHSGGLSYSTISKDLAYGVSLLLRRFNIPHTLQHYNERIGIDGLVHKPAFEVRVRNAAYIKKLAELVDMPINHQMQEKEYPNTIFEKDSNFYHKIDEIEVLEYEGTVYNLNVENSHTYVCAGGLVDNCHPRDNIAMSWLAKEKNLSHNLFEDIMLAREDQTEFLANVIIEEHLKNPKLPIVLLGKSFKPGTAITTGSPAILLANILTEKGIKFTHLDPYGIDIVILKEPALFFIATKHLDFKDYKFPKDSTIIDPHRYIGYQHYPNVKIISIGKH